ncbi:hypothetical protein ABD76_22110 [Paenibacillus dendritiformis]|nr:hypothetical protein [Paenibacillus dendritiformis]
MLNMGLRVARVELVDERTVGAVNRFKETAFIQAPTLFVEFSGAKQNLTDDLEAEQLDGAILGHVGDGNFHAVLVVDPDDPQDVGRAKRVYHEIVMHALTHGGTCTGEHGIGLGKREYLQAECGNAVMFMQQIKKIADPTNILNPGKIFLTEGK